MSPRYKTHRPDFEGTTKESWDAPGISDYDAEDPADLADSFLLSASGFPPEDADDLALPVVDTDDNLNLNALEEAREGAEGVDVEPDIEPPVHAEARRLVEKLIQENFESGDPEAKPKDPEARQQRQEARDAAQSEKREHRAEEETLREGEAQNTNREDIPPDEDASG